jgi:hypothetical protein
MFCSSLSNTEKKSVEHFVSPEISNVNILNGVSKITEHMKVEIP